MGKRTLYLVRHGEYVLRLRDKGMLTEVGVQQAQLTARALQRTPFKTMYYSPMQRAVQTAEIIGEALPTSVQICSEALSECLPSIPERYTQYFKTYLPEWSPERIQACVETLDDFFRVYFVPTAVEEDTHELLVCHGNIIRYFVGQVLKLPIDSWASLIIHHCGITRILIDHEQMYLVSHNDIGHLPEALLST